MKERMQRFAWSSARVVLDSVLSKLSRQQQRGDSNNTLAKSFLLCSRPLLKEYTDIVLRGSHNGSTDTRFVGRVCRGLLPLILYANTDAVEQFFEDSTAFTQLVTLSRRGPIQSKTLALRLLRKLLPTRPPQHWNDLCTLGATNNPTDKQTTGGMMNMLDMLLDRVGRYMMTVPGGKNETFLLSLFCIPCF